MAEETKSNKQSSQEQEFKRNRPELDGVPDLSQLVYLDMPNVLHNLKHRYCKMKTKQCYTSISSILLAINPYESLPIYGSDVINEFHSSALKGRLVQGRPHPYGVSARSYMRMVQRKCNQSVIVCGESGAGKTETTKLLMRYLAMTAPISVISSKDTTSSVEEQIVAASPILEAYGNAKTVMNNNSSRFGKFTKLLYNVPANTQQGTILGSSLETYLLEKSRVVYQALNERNYHIFYFLHAGLGNNNSEYGLQTIDKFNYTNQGKCFMPMKDIERYEELTEMLTKFRIEENVQNILWKLTAGVLNIGNINFIRTGDGFTDIDKKSMKYLNIVSKLWGLKPTELEKRLTTKSLKVGNNNITQKIQFDSAVSNRDSIAKGIYENIFLWLCKRINAELLVEDEEEDEIKVDDKYFIGILDVFGFENFYFNSLEQFCINYTNEKLQQFFNFHIIASEQEEYIREGVFWKPLTIPDNKDYIQLVENNKIGFFTLLDSACTGPSKNDTIAFMQTLFRKQGKNSVIKQVTKPGSGNWRGEKPQNARRRRGGGQKFDGFMINHFADDVTYDISKFLIKNMESVHSDTNKMIKKSKESIFKEINGVDGISKKRRRRGRKSVTSVFYGGIKRLMRSLNQTEPYFVRCINPNKQKSSKVWNEGIVQHQLRCGGLLEALRVLKLGYPTRVPYKLLYEKYHSHVSNPLIKNMSAEAFSTSLLIAFDVNENDYELGLTKIFFKPSKAAILDTIMDKAGQPLTKQQNDKITKYIVDKRCKQIIGVVKAFTNIRKMIRMKRASKQWESKGRIAALIGGTVMKHLSLAKNIIKKRKQKQASVLMQTFFRAMYERKHFIKHIDKVKKSSKIIWLAYNNMKQRYNIITTLDKLIAKRNAMPKPKPKPKPEPVVREPAVIKPIVNTIEISKEEQLKIAREKQREEDEKQRELRKAIELEKVKQDQRGSIEIDERKQSGKKKRIEAKIERERIATENKEKRRKQGKEKTRQQKKAKRDRIRKQKYKQNPGDTTDYDTDRDTDDDYYQTDTDTDTDTDNDEEMDIKTALAKFHKIAAMGQLFFRHAGSRSRNKPQDRVVKISFDHDHKPMEISWGSGSRQIYFKDILYISYGHYTPVFNLRKDILDEQKCFSIVAKSGNGIMQCLDLEGYNEYIAELWVKGLRKLKGHTQEYSDIMAKKNMKNLIHNSSDSKRRRANDKKKITDIMKLQQDLFIMSTHTVLRHLEEERIWNIDDALKEKFEPKKMYPIALKSDIPWRQWQHWLREQITTYLRENNGVIPKYSYNVNNNNNFNASGTMIFNTEQIKQINQPISPYIDNTYNSATRIPSNNNVYSGVNTYVNNVNNQAEYPKKKRESIGDAEDEKCSLM